MHDHHGHRDRMRERFAQGGLSGFAPHEALELLLFYAIPRQDVNPLAHRLLNHFGTLGAVLEASPDELTKVPGIGANAASLIAMILPMYRYAERERQAEKAVITTYKDARLYSNHLFDGKAEEVLYVICLDAGGRVLRAVPAITGTIDEIAIYPRTIVSTALRHHAHAVVLAHNHPSGVREPSEADILTTNTLREALSAVDIALLDHVIYADGDCVSMAQWQKTQGIVPLHGAAEPTPKAADTKQPRRKPSRPAQNKDKREEDN